jgi:GNAT superfamily N-acetyltransferase
MYATCANDRPTTDFEIHVGSASDIDALCEIDLDASRLFESAGFAASGVRDREPYLDQLSVRTQYMRRRIGTALLTAAEKLAVIRGGRALWLTTYGHLSWNRPFYERAGFAVMSESAWGPEILEESAYERRWLPCPAQRIVMRKPLRSTGRLNRGCYH